jgi:hypothetical protein
MHPIIVELKGPQGVDSEPTSLSKAVGRDRQHQRHAQLARRATTTSELHHSDRQRLHQGPYRSVIFKASYRIDDSVGLGCAKPSRRGTAEFLFYLGSCQRILRRAFRRVAFRAEDRAVCHVSFDPSLLGA